MNDKYISRDNLELVIDGLKVGMTPDWNENDKNEFGYIRNKPFYTDGDIVHQLDEKYIPDSVARIEDVEVGLENIFTEIDSQKMNATDPVGTGSFSMNRKEGTNIGNYSHAEGYKTTASGVGAHAEGIQATASGGYSHVEGCSNIASGDYSHAEGGNAFANGGRTTASGEASHAEGAGTTASGMFSHAEGRKTTASGMFSHAEGSETNATAAFAHAEGDGTTASGEASHAEGTGTSTMRMSQHVQGENNIIDTYGDGIYKRGKYAHIVGNGSSIHNRSNAHTLDWNGVGWFQGGLQVGGASQDGEGVGYVPAVPAGVQVGQTIVVKSVDENGKPTAWECVDAQSDWNQNDETKSDYVKNRPFWTDEITILELGIIDGFEDGTAGSGAAYKYSNLDERLSVSASDILKVSWDGTVYECECMTDEDGLLFFGNPSITDDGEDSGEPFFFVIEDITEIYASSGTSHTVGITTEEAHKLDSKYLPTAAAVADVTATPTADEFNALLAVLRDAGYLAT